MPSMKFFLLFLSAIVLALAATSCASTSGTNSYYHADSSGTVKGATLLMQRP